MALNLGSLATNALNAVNPFLGAAAQAYTSSNAHTGSWGTKDFGATELVGKVLGSGTTAQGGSNLTNYVGQLPTAYPSVGTGGVYGSGTPSSQNQVSGGGGGGGGGSAPTSDPNAPQYGWGQEFPNMDAYNQYRDQMTGQISGAWDGYLNSLDQQMGALPGQRGTLESIAQNQYQAGTNEINSQKNLGMQDIGRAREKVQTEQKSTLQDLAEDLRNSFLAGNIYLGSRGAGDSSAANQYSFALQKMGNKNRGDVMAQSRELNADIGQREARLNEVTNQEINKLGTDRDNKILEVAQWFESAQNSVRQAQAEGRLQKGLDLAALSRDLLNQATTRLQQIEDRFMNQRDALTQWATNQSTGINQLKSNLAQISNITVPSYSQFGSIGASTPTVDAQGNILTAGYGYSRDEDKYGARA